VRDGGDDCRIEGGDDCRVEGRVVVVPCTLVLLGIRDDREPASGEVDLLRTIPDRATPLFSTGPADDPDGDCVFAPEAPFEVGKSVALLDDGDGVRVQYLT
jgi:hypothetical protein